MAEKWIEKEYEKIIKDKEGNPTGEKEIVKTKYRIDADFEPAEANEICIEFIANYCIAQGKEEIKWLKGLINKKVAYKNKNGEDKERQYSQLEIRKEFIDRHFKKLKAKGKAKTTTETILELLDNAL